MMALLLAKNKMDFAGLLFPRVGHSHGALGAWNGFNMSFNFVSLRRIISQPFLSLSLSDNFAQRWDQLFGVLAAAVRYVDLICDPSDLVVTFSCA